MRSIYAVVGRVRSNEEVDWESPAGPVDRLVRPRLDVPAFLFTGPGDGHWIGQRCDVLECLEDDFQGPEDPQDPNRRLVRLACGCQARVTRGSLQPV
jgi:hypothetical protein